MKMSKQFKVMGMLPATMSPILGELPVDGFKSYDLIEK